MRLPKQPFRGFSISVLGFSALILLVFTLANTRVNPLWVSKAPWTDDGYADYRPIYRYQRTAKAGIAAARSWEVAFFGSSRIDIAFDPQLPGWQGKPVANLAVSAGVLPETAAIVHYTLQHSPLETAIVGIDIGDLMGKGTRYPATGFTESPFNSAADPVEQRLRYYAGISSFQSAVQTIANRQRHRLAEYTPQGHRLRHEEAGNVSQVIHRDAIPHALRMIRRRKARPPGEPDAARTGLLQQILDETKAAGCRLVLVIPPSHACYQGVFYHESDVDPVFSKDRSLMVRMVAASNAAHPGSPPAGIWDFNDFHPLNREPVPEGKGKMHWWLDGTHARKELGDIMLARIMGWPIEGPGQDYGFPLTAANLEERVGMLRAGYEDFSRSDPEMLRWMEEGIGKYGVSRKSEDEE